MSTPAKKPCSCAPLARPLPSGQYKNASDYPDHVCDETRRAAIERFARPFAITLPESISYGEPGSVIHVPLDMHQHVRIEWDGNKQIALPVPIVLASTNFWEPFGEFYLPLSEWAEVPDDKLPALLKRSYASNLQFAENHAKSIIERMEKDIETKRSMITKSLSPEYIRSKEGITLEETYIKPEIEAWERAFDLIEKIRAEALINSGLPATPGTAAYILHRLRPGHPEAKTVPTRGALVNTKYILPSNQFIELKGTPYQTVDYMALSTTKEVSEKAASTCRNHIFYWERLFTEYRNQTARSVNTGAPEKHPELRQNVRKLFEGIMKEEDVHEEHYQTLRRKAPVDVDKTELRRVATKEVNQAIRNERKKHEEKTV